MSTTKQTNKFILNMSKRPNMTSEEYLISAPLPEATETYTVIPHKQVIERTKQVLDRMGFEIERELYRCNLDAKVAQGIYHLKYSDDPDIGMLFAWNNSYDKSMRFKCCIGGYVHASLASIISGNMGNYARKHTGNADNEVLDTIDNQLINAEEYFKELLIQKNQMLNIKLTERTRAELLGRMYFVNELFTSEQMSVISKQLAKSSYAINGSSDTAWHMYHAVLVALQKAHPKTWMNQQIISHDFLVKELVLVQAKQDDISSEIIPEEISNQITILDVIAEVEQEQQVENEVEETPWEDEVKPAGFESVFDTPLEIKVKQEDVIGLNETLPEGSVELFADSVVEDEGWPCVSCNEMQGPDAVWHDGQLCDKCVTNNINLEL